MSIKEVEKDFVKQFGKGDLKIILRVFGEQGHGVDSECPRDIRGACLAALDYECAGRFRKYHGYKKLDEEKLRRFMHKHRKALLRVKGSSSYMGMLAGVFTFLTKKEYEEDAFATKI